MSCQSPSAYDRNLKEDQLGEAYMVYKNRHGEEETVIHGNWCTHLDVNNISKWHEHEGDTVTMTSWLQVYSRVRSDIYKDRKKTFQIADVAVGANPKLKPLR